MVKWTRYARGTDGRQLARAAERTLRRADRRFAGLPLHESYPIDLLAESLVRAHPPVPRAQLTFDPPTHGRLTSSPPDSSLHNFLNAGLSVILKQGVLYSAELTAVSGGIQKSLTNGFQVQSFTFKPDD